MKLGEIFEPISKELSLVEEEIRSMVNDLGVQAAEEVIGQFFANPGKYLRPALLLLSYKLINPQEPKEIDYKLIQLAMCMELIHNASLIHDDIIDGDFSRRGQETLNNIFGNKIAVLAGDTLYTRVFLIMANTFPREYLQITAHMAERMCISEIEQAKDADNISDKSKYLGLIKDKTAFFMSVCCRLGARFAGASESDAGKLSDFGMNFGMTYQVIDDIMDNDETAERYISLKDAEQYVQTAKATLEGFEDSIYKEKLGNLADFVLSFAHAAAE